MAVDNELKIGGSLKRFRKEFKLTQDNVADTIGIMRPAYSNYEGNKNMPSVDTVMKIAIAYNVSMDYLVGLSDMPRPPKVSEVDNDLIEAVIACNKALHDVLEKRGLNDDARTSEDEQ